jgi:hypothetical protein
MKSSSTSKCFTIFTATTSSLYRPCHSTYQIKFVCHHNSIGKSVKELNNDEVYVLYTQHQRNLHPISQYSHRDLTLELFAADFEQFFEEVAQIHLSNIFQIFGIFEKK